MSRPLFIEIMKIFNERQKKKGTKALVLLDNCPSHVKVAELFDFTHIHFHFCRATALLCCNHAQGSKIQWFLPSLHTKSVSQIQSTNNFKFKTREEKMNLLWKEIFWIKIFSILLRRSTLTWLRL
jgi:hypothetical protein